MGGIFGWLTHMLKKVKTKKQFFVEKFGTIISFITDFSLSQQEDIFKVFG